MSTAIEREKIENQIGFKRLSETLDKITVELIRGLQSITYEKDGHFLAALTLLCGEEWVAEAKEKIGW